MAEWLGTREIAERYGRTVATAARWCREGRLPGAFLVGRTWVIPSAALEGFEPPEPGRPDDDEPED
jgi:excisionase family DNA binding protein